MIDELPRKFNDNLLIMNETPSRNSTNVCVRVYRRDTTGVKKFLFLTAAAQSSISFFFLGLCNAVHAIYTHRKKNRHPVTHKPVVSTILYVKCTSIVILLRRKSNNF